MANISKPRFNNLFCSFAAGTVSHACARSLARGFDWQAAVVGLHVPLSLRLQTQFLGQDSVSWVLSSFLHSIVYSFTGFEQTVVTQLNF